MAKTTMSKRARLALRAEMVAAFQSAAADPQLRDFGDAACLVIGRLSYVADPDLDVVALWKEMREALGPLDALGGIAKKLASLQVLADDVRQLTLLPKREQTLPLYPDGREDWEDHDRMLCDCLDCVNWRRAMESQR